MDSATPRPRLFQLGALCFLLTGMGHMALHLSLMLRTQAVPTAEAFRAMEAAELTAVPPSRTLLHLFNGESAAMSLLFVALGALGLVLARRAPGLVGSTPSLHLVNALASAGILALSLLAFPFPPMLLMSVALACFAASGWRAWRRRAGSRRPSVHVS